MLKWLILPFAFLWWSAAHAADEVSLEVGETVELGIASDGTVTVKSRAKALPLNDFDANALVQLAGIEVPPGVKTMPPQVISNQKKGSVPPISSDILRISLRDVPGKSQHDRLLIIENGYGKAFRYKAILHKADRAAATDVCLVMPGKRGYEHWPYAFDHIDLNALTLVEWKESDGISCA